MLGSDIALLSNFSLIKNCEFEDPLLCPKTETRDIVSSHLFQNLVNLWSQYIFYFEVLLQGFSNCISMHDISGFG